VIVQKQGTQWELGTPECSIPAHPNNRSTLPKALLMEECQKEKKFEAE
jgi:hypothetical protein